MANLLKRLIYGPHAERQEALQSKLQYIPKEGSSTQRRLHTITLGLIEEEQILARREFIKRLFGVVVATTGGVMFNKGCFNPQDSTDSDQNPTDSNQKAGQNSSYSHENIDFSYLDDIQIPPNLNLPRNTYTSIDIPRVINPEDPKKRLEIQKRWQDITEHALERFVSINSLSSKLFKHFKKHSYNTIPVNPRVTRLYETKERIDEIINDNLSFEIVFMPEEFVKYMQSSVVTEYDNPTVVRIAGNFPCEEWLSIMLYHELKHVYDVDVEGEADGGNDHSIWLMGEVKAHEFENELLRAWDPESYDFFIENGIQILESTGGNIRQLLTFANRIYPIDILNGHAMAIAQASCLIAVLFEMAKKKMASDEQLSTLYDLILKASGKGDYRKVFDFIRNISF